MDLRPEAQQVKHEAIRRSRTEGKESLNLVEPRGGFSCWSANRHTKCNGGQETLPWTETHGPKGTSLEREPGIQLSPT